MKSRYTGLGAPAASSVLTSGRCQGSKRSGLHNRAAFISYAHSPIVMSANAPWQKTAL
jgi:hypothetical protein